MTEPILASTGNITLGLVEQLIDILRVRDIQYCQFKSVIRIDQALQGSTDLDILVPRGGFDRFVAVLVELGFKAFLSPNLRQYPGVQDWLGFDQESGRLVHVHLHSRMVTGARFIKQFELPYEDLIVERAIAEERCGIRIVCPEDELLLFFIRTLLRRNYIESWIGRYIHKWKHEDEELKFLKSRVTEDELASALSMYIGTSPVDSAQLARKLFGVESVRDLRRIWPGMKNEFVQYRRISRPTQWIRYHKRWAQYFIQRSGLRGYRKRRKTPASGGIKVAIVGCDGSGKTTLQSDLIDWLRSQIEAEGFYLGSGNGGTVWFLSLAKKTWSYTRPRRAETLIARTPVSSAGPRSDPQRRSGLLVAIFAQLLVMHRRRTLREANRFAAKGGIAVTVRYPQSQVHGQNDGPLLVGDNSLFGRWVHRQELHLCEWATHARRLDLLIILRGKPATLSKRRPEMNLASLERKLAEFDSIDWPFIAQIVIDSELPMAEVLSITKRAIWDKI